MLYSKRSILSILLVMPPSKLEDVHQGGRLSAYPTVTVWPQNVFSTVWTSCWRRSMLPNRCTGWSAIQNPTTRPKPAIDGGRNGSQWCYLVLQQNFLDQSFLRRNGLGNYTAEAGLYLVSLLALPVHRFLQISNHSFFLSVSAVSAAGVPLCKPSSWTTTAQRLRSPFIFLRHCLKKSLLKPCDVLCEEQIEN